MNCLQKESLNSSCIKNLSHQFFGQQLYFTRFNVRKNDSLSMPLAEIRNFQNVQESQAELSNNTMIEPYDFIVLTETWLTSDFPDSELGCVNYNIFRMD